jgi:hypothetical protein
VAAVSRLWNTALHAQAFTLSAAYAAHSARSGCAGDSASLAPPKPRTCAARFASDSATDAGSCAAAVRQLQRR